MKFELTPTGPNPDEVRARVIAGLRSSRDRSSIVVGGVFFFIGVGLLTGAFLAFRHDYNILKNWPTVDALVLRSEVTRGRDRDTTMYGTEIEFQYSVNGKQYQTPSSSSYKTSSYTEMKREADAFAPGTRHSLLYNPSDPNDIRFDAGYTLSYFLVPAILGGMGIVFSGVGGLVWYLFRSQGPGLLCPKCGRPIEPDQEFCPHCATPLTNI